ncbi:MAG TPA: DegV family protein [Patescibacteria group bacterium]|nr:DegV family protein [Patescibacteria group bacterium]
MLRTHLGCKIPIIMSKENVVVVTDSTASVSKNEAAKYGIEVVPLRLGPPVDPDRNRDGVDIDTNGLVELMDKTGLIPKTSGPPPGDFEDAYKRHPDSDIISIHLLKKASSTVSSAETAASEVAASRSKSRRIVVYDSGTMSMGLGFLAQMAAELSRKGASIEEIIKKLDSMRSRTEIYALINSMKNVAVGGRLGAITRLIGTGLGIKPVIKFTDGNYGIYKAIRSENKALAEIVDLTEAHGRENGLEKVAVVHAGALETAKGVAQEISRFYPEVGIFDCGAVLATHAGPRMVGVVAVRK